MIIDLKYHIASIVAVFLALGIGIFVGSALIGQDVNDVIVYQQNKMFEDLKKNLDKLRIDNKTAREEINTYKTSLEIEREFEKAILPGIVNGKLQGKKIAVIETNNSGLHDEWIETLKAAGASITSITTVLEGFDLSDELKRKSVATVLMIDHESKQTVASEVSNEIAAAIHHGQNLENLRYFEHQGMIKTSGEYGVPVDSIVIAGGSNQEIEGRFEFVDTPVIKYFVKNKIPVSGVETSNVKFSYMKQYQKFDINTVDNIDLAPGQLSLVMAISGQTGNYGIKNTAHQLIPVLR